MMRICIITSTDMRLRHGFEISFAGEIGAVEVFNLSITRASGRRLKRRVYRAAEAVRQIGISVCAAEDGFLYTDVLRKFGLKLSSVRRLEGAKLAEMALLFVNALGHSPKNTRFILSRGGFETMLNVAVCLSRVSRNIIFNCISGADIAEALLVRTGAVARLLENAGPIRKTDVVLAVSEEEGAILKSGDISITFADFEVLLPERYKNIIPSSCAATFAASLMACGFLCADEIKIALRCAEIVK